ncbi:T-cell ecto-ADP-ribosyltransferase 2-like [Mantella aurantiaca]
MRQLGRILTVFCLFILKVEVEGEDDFEVMGLAEEAFDDQYLGCRQAMEYRIKAEGVLEAELSFDRSFRRAWQEAEQIWSEMMKDRVRPDLPEGFRDLHGIAVVAYTGFIREKFNQAVKSAGKSYRDYMDNFHFKALHYYLTVALQLLYRDCRGEVHSTYRGFHQVQYWLPPGTSKVRFGHFLHTSSSESMASEMGNASFITVLGCPGVPVDKFSEYPGEEEVVFPGYEVFSVMEAQEDLSSFSLQSTAKWCSNFNCALVQGDFCLLGEISGMSLADCVFSEDDVTWSDRGAWLRNMTEVIFSAAPSGITFHSGDPSLLILLTAAVVTFLCVFLGLLRTMQAHEGYIHLFGLQNLHQPPVNCMALLPPPPPPD